MPSRKNLLLVLCMLAVLGPFVWADSNARIVRLSYAGGDVKMDNGHGYDTATMNVPVIEGNRLSTGDDGRAEVELEDGSTIRLASDTEMEFTQLSRLSSGDTVTVVTLNQGEAEFNVSRHDDDQFQVNVANKQVSLRKSSRFRIYADSSSPLQLVVWKGEVGVQDSDSGAEVAIKKNEMFTLDADDPGRYQLSKNAEEDDLDQWSAERDDYLAAYGRNGRSNSPYQYGANDLNYYGQYYDVPGYGYLWQPYNVGYSWDPFGNGYWCYYPGFGYTWVSSYPWGWMPYRYGQWVFINGRGWMWQPGFWRAWHPVPPVINAPRGFRPPVPPVIGGAGRLTAGAGGPLRGNDGRPIGPPPRMSTQPGVRISPSVRMNGGEARRPVQFGNHPGNDHAPVGRIEPGEGRPQSPPAMHPPARPSQSPPNRAPSTEPSRPSPPPRMTPPPQRPSTPPPAAPRMSPPASPPRMSPPPERTAPPRQAAPPQRSFAPAQRSFSPPAAPRAAASGRHR